MRNPDLISDDIEHVVGQALMQKGLITYTQKGVAEVRATVYEVLRQVIQHEPMPPGAKAQIARCRVEVDNDKGLYSVFLFAEDGEPLASSIARYWPKEEDPSVDDERDLTE